MAELKPRRDPDPLSRCDVCDKGFAKADHLRAHKRAHGRPYPCEICDAAFACPTHVATHRDTVHVGEKPFTCDVCGAAIADLFKLKIHKKILHWNKEA